jgi:putative transposase
MQKFRVSERLACRVLGQHRSTQRKVPRGRPDEEALTADIIALASQYGRYGYRRITALLRDAGWVVNVKRVERHSSGGKERSGGSPRPATGICDGSSTWEPWRRSRRGAGNGPGRLAVEACCRESP